MNETRHPVGLCTIAAADTALSLDQVLTLAAETGFDGVEVWGHPRHLGLDASLQQAQAVRRQCASLGLSVLTYGSYLRLLTPTFEQDMRLALHVTEMLGAPRLRLWAGQAGSDQTDETLFALAREQLTELAQQALRPGITGVLELHDHTLCDTPDAAHRLLQPIATNNVGVCVQPSWRNGSPDFSAILAALLPRVHVLHAQNYTGDYNHRVHLDEGDVDYSTVMRLLAMGGRGVPLMVEFAAHLDRQSPAASLAHDCRVLKRLRRECEGSYPCRVADPA